jgi:hypothetical protein
LPASGNRIRISRPSPRSAAAAGAAGFEFFASAACAREVAPSKAATAKNRMSAIEHSAGVYKLNHFLQHSMIRQTP